MPFDDLNEAELEIALSVNPTNEIDRFNRYRRDSLDDTMILLNPGKWTKDQEEVYFPRRPVDSFIKR